MKKVLPQKGVMVMMVMNPKKLRRHLRNEKIQHGHHIIPEEDLFKKGINGNERRRKKKKEQYNNNNKAKKIVFFLIN